MVLIRTEDGSARLREKCVGFARKDTIVFGMGLGTLFDASEDKICSSRGCIIFEDSDTKLVTNASQLNTHSTRRSVTV